MVSEKSLLRSIPIARSYFDRLEEGLVAKVIRSGWIGEGRLIQEFENSISVCAGAKYCVATSSGTTALHLALIISKIGPGDEVIVPSFSFIATANAVLYCGAKPLFIDIDPRTYNIDPVKIEEFIEGGCRVDRAGRLINKKTLGRVKAIMPVHQFGLACDMDAISRIAKRYRLSLVEDAACALGSMYKGRPIGHASELACFSFHPRKILTTGEGGAIVTSRKSYRDTAMALRNHGMSKKKGASEDYAVLGYNYRLTDLQAAIGLGQISKLADILKKRKYLAARYDRAFAKTGVIETPYIPPYAAANYQSYVIKISGSSRASRDGVIRGLLEYGISARRGNTAIHLQTLYKKKGVTLPFTEEAAHTTIALPIYFKMTDAEQDLVIDKVCRSCRPL